MKRAAEMVGEGMDDVRSRVRGAASRSAICCAGRVVLSAVRMSMSCLGLLAGVLLVVCGEMAQAQVSTTAIQGTVYRADGRPAQGSLLISWPAFTTAKNQAVAAGTVTVTIGADGFASVALAPNVGANPAGSYYTAVYHLNDGTVSKEYWVVPAAASATIGAVRAQLQPATVAVRSVSEATWTRWWRRSRRFNNYLLLAATKIM